LIGKGDYRIELTIDILMDPTGFNDRMKRLISSEERKEDRFLAGIHENALSHKQTQELLLRLAQKHQTFSQLRSAGERGLLAAYGVDPRLLDGDLSNPDPDTQALPEPK
jgi:hypothetical protein